MEDWKAVPGYEGLYEVSTLGRIRSVSGRTTIDSSGRIKHWQSGRIMKLKYSSRRTTSKMDARVCLCKESSVKTFLVARIVALAWCEGYKEGLTVNHIDGDTLNNTPDNLEWISNADNIRHGFETGQYSTQKPCSLVDENGNVMHFRSRAEACRKIGRPSSYIAKCLRRNRPIRSSGGIVYGFI